MWPVNDTVRANFSRLLHSACHDFCDENNIAPRSPFVSQSMLEFENFEFETCFSKTTVRFLLFFSATLGPFMIALFGCPIKYLLMKNKFSIVKYDFQFYEHINQLCID